MARPDSDSELARLVQTYAGSESKHGRTMFANSLRAALTVAEVQSLVVELVFSAADVQLTSDRHWTWQTKTAAAVDPRSH